MLGQPKGYVIIDKELKFTREPPEIAVMGLETVNLKEEYFEALKLKMVPVIDIAVDNSSYLVLGTGKHGQFLWDIDKRDCVGEMIPYTLVHPENPRVKLERLVKVLGEIETGKLSDDSLDWITREAEKLGFRTKPEEKNHDGKGTE